MAGSLDPSLRGLNDCDGCEGISPETPLTVENRPGLDRFNYRLGTHGRFLESMLARISSAKHPALKSLRTRDKNDLTIAYLDACAAVDDGLTFYTERYAQEWFVRTASERVSLVQLARLIGYEPRPGVAANTSLAFTIETTPGTPEKTTIPASTRIMSIPGEDELPQFFETDTAIEARAEWNAMKARARQPQAIRIDMDVVIVSGLESSIKRGDSILIVETDDSDEVTGTKVKRVQRIVQDPVAGETRLELGEAPTPSTASGGWTHTATYTITTMSEPLTNAVFDDLLAGGVYSSSNINALNLIYGWSPLYFTIAANTPKASEPAQAGVYALQLRAGIFGHNAPKWASLPQIVQGQDVQITGRVLESSGSPETDSDKWQYPKNWDDLTLAEQDGLNTGEVDLDNTYPRIIDNSWIVLESPTVPAGEEKSRAYRVVANEEKTRADYTLSVKVSRLTLEGADSDFGDFKMRDTTVYGGSEQLPLADLAIEETVRNDTVTLDQYYPGLVAGQWVILTGERADLRGVTDHEVRKLEDVQMNGSLEVGRYFTDLKFTEPLEHEYLTDTVRVNANVAPATHGESKEDVLGGGDGSTRFKTFALKQSPLTYVSAQTPTGAQSTLEVRVNDVLWQEVDSLYGRKADEQVYVIRHEDDGNSLVQFNSPLPTGQENIRAKYRIGIGLPGILKPDQLSMLAVKPLGVQGVTNPLAPSGAQDRESIENLRENSPLTVMTLGRLVSLKDYEDFTRAFAGFSKALATPTQDGDKQGVFLTVGGESGEVSQTSAEFENLVLAIKDNSDPFVKVVVKPYVPVFFQVEAQIGYDPSYLPENVSQAVQDSLMTTFDYPRRRFGQPVTLAEVVAVIQNNPGVVFVNITALFKSDPLNPDLPKTLEEGLSAALPTPGVSLFSAQAAELITIDPRPILLTMVKV